MSYLNSILQGLIQGFTEFLPVSSSGHLSLFQHFTGVSSESSVVFSIMLHLATLGAVIIAFHKTVWKLIIEFFSMIGDIFTLKIGKKHITKSRKMLYMLMLSCVPLLFILPFKDFVMSISSDNSILAEGIFFLITTGILFVADKCIKGNKNCGDVTPKDSIVIGVAQCIATLPGVSRSGSTISAGLLTGLKREAAVAYSFILGMPTILAAALLEIKDIVSGNVAVDIEMMPAIVGMIVALISGVCAIKLVNYIVKTDKFKIFAIYTLILGTVTIATVIIENVMGISFQNIIMSLFA